MMTDPYFWLGLFIGCNIGLLVCSLFVAARKNDSRSEDCHGPHNVS